MTAERNRNREDGRGQEPGRYHRPRKPVEVRRRARWKQALRGTGWILLAAILLAAVGGVGFGIYTFARTSALFHLRALGSVEVSGVERVSGEAVRALFAADVGGSVFAVPLGERRSSLQEIAWVESAAVQRLLPDRLRVELRERTPVAFLRAGRGLRLIDRQGVVLPVPEGASYSFLVLTGLSGKLTRPERARRVELYQELVAELDRDGTPHSARLSEVDLRDPDNLAASIAEEGRSVWLLFGRGDYREKFENYLEHRALWQQSGETVRAVDLRYRGQLVLNPDLSSRAKR
ncbi:MAG: cell division protein FtsQ/DivIB [Terriglobia bacterium]